MGPLQRLTRTGMLQRLLVGLRRKLLRTAASSSQARGSQKDTRRHKKLQAVPVPFRSCHLQTLNRRRPEDVTAAAKEASERHRPPKCRRWMRLRDARLGLALGDKRGLADRGLA